MAFLLPVSQLKGDGTIGKWWKMNTWLSKQEPILFYSNQPCEDTHSTEKLEPGERFLGSH